MSDKKTPCSLLLSILVCLISIATLDVQANEKSDRTAYTQASSSNLRSTSASDAEIVQKLPINTKVDILDKKPEWVFVQVSGDESLKGWLHQSLIAAQALSLEEALKRYEDSAQAAQLRLKWIERAAALAPEDIDVLNELAQTLRGHGEYARADAVLENIEAMKARQSEPAAEQKPQAVAAEDSARMWESIASAFIRDKLRQPIKPEQWQSWAGVPVFLEGPHRADRIDFNNQSEFGHYNPEFLKWALELIPDRPEGLFYQSTQAVFKAKFSEQFEYLAIAAAILDTQPAMLLDGTAVYKRFIADGKHFSPQEGFPGLRAHIQAGDYYYLAEGEAFAFWIRRSIDGTFDTLQQIVRKIAEIYDPKTYQTMMAIQANYEPVERKTVAFTPASFIDFFDVGFQESLLRCRSQLIAKLAPELAGIEVRHDKPVIKNITHAVWQEVLFSTPGCAQFSSDRDYFGLHATAREFGNLSLSWKPAAFKFEGTIERQSGGCEGLNVSVINLTVNDQTGEPLVWIGLPKGEKPGAAVALQGELPKPGDFSSAKAARVEVDLSGQVPAPLKSLRLRAEYIFVEGDVYSVKAKQVDLESTLDGQSYEVLHSSKGWEGKYDYTNAFIGGVVAGDFDADGNLELLFNTMGNGRTLLELDSSGKPTTREPLINTGDLGVIC